MPNIPNLVDFTTMVNGIPIQKYDLRGNFATQTKAQRKNIRNIRTAVTRKVSDYISEEVGAAFGVRVSRANKAAFKDAQLTTGDAAPDFQANISQFESFFKAELGGTKISETQAIKSEATSFGNAWGHMRTFFAETKVKIFGTERGTDFSAPTVSGKLGAEDPIALAINKLLKSTKGSTGPQAMAALFPPWKTLGLTGDALTLWQTNAAKVKAVATAKIENLFYVNINDSDKSRKIELMFMPNILVGAKKLDTEAGFKEFFEVGFKYRGGGKDTYRMQISPTPKLKAKLEKSGIDLTNKIKQLHMDMHSVKFSEGLMAYLVNQLQKTYEGQPNNVAIALGFAVAFAEEFQEGGLTPFTIKTDIVVPMAVPVIQNILLKRAKAKKAGRPQKFISGAQITALVQKRLLKIMPQGPRRGPPLSPTIMTNRTGRFRRSIHVIPRYRENIMRYMYDPIYMSLVDTSYNPDTLVANTIREVVQGLFGRQFGILRGM